MEIQQRYSFGGWNNCIRMTNGKVELIITTDIGPRVVRFGYVGEQNLLGEIGSEQGKIGGKEWRSYGGHRLWHAPEAMPRSYNPDNSRVKYEVKDDTLILTQDTEEYTGLQKQIEITLNPDDNQVRVLHRIINNNLWGIKFAPWAITVMNLKGRAIIPQEPYQSWNERLTPVRPLALWGYTDMTDDRWTWGSKYIQLSQDPNVKIKQKIGMLNTLGWVAYSLGDQIFIKRYKYNPFAEYADFGVNTEIYTDSDILEIETLGEYKLISPGGKAEHLENWFLFTKEVSKEEKSIDQNLLPLVKNTDKYIS